MGFGFSFSLSVFAFCWLFLYGKRIIQIILLSLIRHTLLLGCCRRSHRRLYHYIFLFNWVKVEILFCFLWWEYATLRDWWHWLLRKYLCLRDSIWIIFQVPQQLINALKYPDSSASIIGSRLYQPEILTTKIRIIKFKSVPVHFLDVANRLLFQFFLL
jgi:hypothetical protein